MSEGESRHSLIRLETSCVLVVPLEATALVLLVALPAALALVEPVAWPAVLFCSLAARPVAEFVVDEVALVLALPLVVADDVSLLATAPLVEEVELVALPLRSLVEDVDAVSLLAIAPLVEAVLEVADGAEVEAELVAFCGDISLLATAPVELVLLVAAVLAELPLVAPEVAEFCAGLSLLAYVDGVVLELPPEVVLLLAKPLVDPVVDDVSALVDGVLELLEVALAV